MEKIYWFRGDEKNGKELIQKLIEKTGATLKPGLEGINKNMIYYVNEDGIVTCGMARVLLKRVKDSKDFEITLT